MLLEIVVCPDCSLQYIAPPLWLFDLEFSKLQFVIVPFAADHIIAPPLLLAVFEVKLQVSIVPDSPFQKIAPAPTAKPTDKPTAAPTAKPTAAPTEKPTDAPTDQPTETPTQVPSEVPTSQPTDSPTDTPVAQPTETPIELPIIPIGPRPKSEVTPTKQPNVTPTNKPSEYQAEEQKTEDASKVKEGALLQFEKTGNEYKITKVITKDGKLIGGNVTYMRCTNKDVKKVIIPAYIKINGVRFNVTKINAKAFKGCSKLKKIIIKTKKLTKIGSKAFSGIHKKAKIKVPKSRYKKYKKMIKKAKTPKKVKVTY